MYFLSSPLETSVVFQYALGTINQDWLGPDDSTNFKVEFLKKDENLKKMGETKDEDHGENYTRNEWRRCETTLETSGEDVKLHSQRVERMLNLSPKETKGYVSGRLC